VGTGVVMFVTALAAVPMGVAAGVYLEEYAPKNWVTTLIEINIANLAGVPSIVYGLMALGLFVYKFKFGMSVLTAGLTLALLILAHCHHGHAGSHPHHPQLHSRSGVRGRSHEMAVGAPPYLPYSAGGILTGVIIGLSRAIGESAPLITIGALTFIAFLPASPLTGTPPYISFEWLTSPYTVLPIQAFNWISRPQKAFHLNAAAAGLVLMGMTLAMNGAAIWIRYRFRKRIKW
jgi:phosphate transport system permease protein